jgi:hypothetical protein
MYILFLTSNIYMPPKRKTKRKPPKRSKSQSQSQRQSVVVNIGKTTSTKRRRNAGRGGLPPPSHLQNLAPTFVTAPQVDYVGLIGEISRLTAKVQDPVPIRNPVTPLQATLQASNAEAQRLAGEQAEARRAGPTAGNFQSPPSRADDRYDNLIAEVDDLISQTPITDQPPVRPPDTAFTEQMVSHRDPPKMGGFGEGGGGQPLSKREQRKAKTTRAKQRLEEDRQELIKLIDEGKDLTLEQSLLVNDPKLKLGKKRVRKGSMLPVKRK